MDRSRPEVDQTANDTVNGPRPGEVPVHVISAPRVVADGVPLGPACVAVERDVLVGVASGGTYEGRRPDLALPAGVLVPGLVDL
jgi:hypothetical protein